MRTFYIATTVFVLFIAWLLHEPIPRAPQVARAFTDAEIDYLEKSFDYAMDMLNAGDHMDWSIAAVNGRISAGKQYTSTQKANCRNYIEIARTYDAQKVESGIACKRSGKDGWCRLNANDAQSCALEVAESSIIKRSRFAILQGTQILDEAMGNAMSIDPKAMLPTMPHIRTPDMPNMPSIETPHIEKPDISGAVHSILPWNNSK